MSHRMQDRRLVWRGAFAPKTIFYIGQIWSRRGNSATETYDECHSFLRYLPLLLTFVAIKMLVVGYLQVIFL